MFGMENDIIKLYSILEDEPFNIYLLYDMVLQDHFDVIGTMPGDPNIYIFEAIEADGDFHIISANIVADDSALAKRYRNQKTLKENKNLSTEEYNRLDKTMMKWDDLYIEERWKIFVEYLKSENIEYKVIKNEYDISQDDIIEFTYNDIAIYLNYSGPHFAFCTDLTITEIEKEKCKKILNGMDVLFPNGDSYCFQLDNTNATIWFPLFVDDLVYLSVDLIFEDKYYTKDGGQTVEDVYQKLPKYLDNIISLTNDFIRKVEEITI
jgi:hypothetical protein